MDSYHYAILWDAWEGNVFALNLKDGGKPLRVSEQHHRAVSLLQLVTVSQQRMSISGGK